MKKGGLLRNILNSTFHGATGRVAFGKEKTKERNSEDASMGLYNIVPNAVNPETGKRSFRSVLVATYTRQEGWVNVPNTTIVYRDGTTTTPETVREFDNNYVSTPVRAIGLALMAIAMIVSFSCLVLTQKYANDPVVLRAQPFFLKILCMGSFVMSLSIFTLAFDEGAGWDDHHRADSDVLRTVYKALEGR